jgi:hypothetical protein
MSVPGTALSNLDHQGGKSRLGRQILRLAVSIASGAIVAIASTSTPAFAHNITRCITSGGLCIASGGVTNNHTRVFACDHRGDGLGVRTWYITGRGGVDYVGDANGHLDGCGRESAFDGGSIDRFQVCMGPLSNETCTAWFNS